MSTEQNMTVVRRWVEEAWNRGHLALADELYPQDYVLHYLPTPVYGAEGLKQFVRTYRAAFPDLHVTIEDMMAAGDKVVWRFTIRGTHRGDFQGIAPTGRPITVTGIVYSRFDGGKWVEDWANADALGMLQQLGVIPEPSGAKSS